jgi:tRNA pseudouridine55 synthase
LRRTGSGKFTIAQCLPLDQIEALSRPEIEKRLIPVYEAAPGIVL